MAILEEHPIECKCDICSFQRCGFYEYPCDQCDDYSEYKPRSNADRIRAMSDEELAEFLASQSKIGESWWLEWLKQEAADEN